MFKIYGSALCPDCVACKTAFDANHIAYEFVDINKSLPALKEFLKRRDTDPAFSEIRGSGRIGIPALVREDGSIFFDWENCTEAEEGSGTEVIPEFIPGAACNIDGSGC